MKFPLLISGQIFACCIPRLCHPRWTGVKSGSLCAEIGTKYGQTHCMPLIVVGGIEFKLSFLNYFDVVDTVD